MPSSQKSKPTRKRRTPRPKARARKPKRLAPADFADSKSIIEIQERPSSIKSADALDFDSGLWGRARTQWMLGDWDSLASLELGHLEQVPHRAELAALSACAQLQKGDKQSARKSLAAASRWKCSPAFMVRALVAGSEACMARYHQISGRDDKATTLLASCAGAFGGDGKLAARTRLVLDAAAGHEADLPDTRLSRAEESKKSDATESGALTLAEAITVAKQQESPWAKPGITSYAQNFEDVMLWRALGHIENGFYIDIGAQHPVADSVSKAFYERGWRGIHVEPTRAYAEMLRKDRPDELVIEAAVSDRHGTMAFYEIPDTGLSTGDAAIADFHRLKGFQVLKRQVPVLTLDDVLAKAGSQDIHWLKIDVEGFEKLVIKGWRNHAIKPWVLVIESTAPNSTKDVSGDWENEVLALGYEFANFDGLSKYYVVPNKIFLKDSLKLPANVFDAFTVNR